MSDSKIIPSTVRRALFVLPVLLSVCAVLGLAHAPAAATPPPPLPTPPAVAESQDAGPINTPAVPSTTQLVFTTVPPVVATVTWGKKRLGRIEPTKPLIVVRPRDSGPLDVIVRAEGFLPVHTRAHTFSDTKVMVRLTALDQTASLLGYRVPIEAGVPEYVEGVLPDGGVAPAPAPPPDFDAGALTY